MCYLWVVSHDAASRHLLRCELQDADIGVAEIGSLGNALTRVAMHGSPCAILLDLGMPAVVRDSIMDSLLVRERLGEVPCVGISNLALLVTEAEARVVVVQELTQLTRGICTPSCHCHELTLSTPTHDMPN
jgi:CheY-like chemotaxis protein